VSLIHWLTDSCSHRLIGSLKFTDLLVQWFTDSLRRGTTDSLIHWFNDLLVHCFIGSLHCWIVASLVHCLCALMHLTTLTVHGFCSANNFPAGHWLLIEVSIFRNFRPDAGRALPCMVYLYDIPSGSGITPELKYNLQNQDWMSPNDAVPKRNCLDLDLALSWFELYAIVCPNLSHFFGIIMINLGFGNAQVITTFQRNPSPSSVGACWFICV
jgi:hypothetical protein